MYAFKPYSDIDVLKIDIANHFGKDKLDFAERIDWFNSRLAHRLNKDSTSQDVYDLLQSITADEPELAFTGLLAYVDYLNQRPSHYMVSFDATGSGIQLMSAITTCPKGMLASNLIDDHRHDPYTEVYEVVKQIYQVRTGSVLDLPRSNFKYAIMVQHYGGTQAAIKHLNNDKELFAILQEASSIVLRGSSKLCDALLSCVDDTATSYSWTTPDGFDVTTDLLVLYYETRNTSKGQIQIKYKDLGQIENYKGNVANLIHSLDATLMREVVGRCMYDIGKAKIIRTKINGFVKGQIPKLDPFYKASKELQHIVDTYKKSGFVTVRVLDYIETLDDIVFLLMNTDKNYIKVFTKLLDKLLKYKPFEVAVIHDCFKCLPKHMNYVRYWYKEIIAEFIECNTLKYMMSQLPNGERLYKTYFEEDFVPETADYVRNSNYAIC